MNTKPQFQIIAEARMDMISEAAKQFVDSHEELIKLIKKDPALKKHIGNRKIYFDDADLVVDSETAATNPIGDDGSVDWNKLSKDILKNIQPDGVPKKLSADQATVGKFVVLLPKEMKGTFGSGNYKLDKPRAIVDADDADSNLIKKEIHSTKEGIAVRIMKRSVGNKVYIDAKDGDSFKIAMDKLKKIK